MQTQKRHVNLVASIALNLSSCVAIVLAAADFAHACLGGHAAYANAILRAGHVTVNDIAVPFPVIDETNANKVLDTPIQLVGSKTLKVHVLYVETTAKYEIASTIYKVEQEGYPPRTIRVQSNITASGIRTRSIGPKPADIPRDPMPSTEETFGCGGAERSSGGSSGTAIGR